jgi:ethanolamine utilization protein EutP (predicted NTPase)
MHENEPKTIEELSKIYHELITGKCTADVPAKIHALEAQMKRLTAEIKAKEAATN